MESKENMMIPELLMVEGLDCQGYGNIYQFVMKDPDLHIYAKALYAFLCSYSGCGSTPYPKRDTITANLMSKDSYYKYLQQLIDNGYIRLKKAHKFPFKTAYILVSNPKKLQEYQQRKMDSMDTGSRLILTGLKSEGYGNIPRIVMLDSRLTPQAKAIYAYLRSISGMGGVAFPAVSEILRHLQIGRSTYNRHFKLLTKYNYIECQQRRINGRFGVTDFYIVENPDLEACAHRVVKFRTSDENTPDSSVSTPETEQEKCASPDSQIWDIHVSDAVKQDTINNTNITNTIITNKSYHSDRVDGEKCAQTQTQAMKERDKYTRILRENIEADYLANQPDVCDYVPLISDILVETVTSKASFHRINGQQIPHEAVKSRLLSLTAEHIEYVISCINKLTTQVRSIRRYFLTALYNAPVSLDAYITQDLRSAGIIA